ncbi:phosphosulfolactate synthase [Nocardia africana]|uniref:Phosphosulfolactate synthase n=1 Tax=Nocardia africana TaxID=134964 RepID=A0ABW6NE91_9NOCA
MAFIETTMELPLRQPKPRTAGLTIAIDNGLPCGLFDDALSSYGELIDIVKFGWGTSLATPDFHRKLSIARHYDVDFMLGGTLFEKYVSRDRYDEYLSLCSRFGCRLIEISNGTIALDSGTKAKFIERAALDFSVIAEVGYKDHPRSELFSPSQWIDAIRSDIDAGAAHVQLEARESGSSGICRADGELRFGLIEDILQSDIASSGLIFESPTKTLQAYFVNRIGAEVNLGNIGFLDVIALETLRLGLRSETLFADPDGQAS